MGILLMVHSILRWIILVVALLALIRLLIGWLIAQRHDDAERQIGLANEAYIMQPAPYDGMSRGLVSGFSGLMDLQAVIGVSLLVWEYLTGVPVLPERAAHAGVLLLAAVLVHFNALWRSAPSPVRYRNSLLLMLIVVLMIIGGVFLLPDALSRWSLAG